MRYILFLLSLCWISSYAQNDRYKLSNKDTLLTCTLANRSTIHGPFSDMHSSDFEKLVEAVFKASPFPQNPYSLFRSTDAATLRIGCHTYDEIEFHTFLLYNLDSVMNYNLKAKTRYGLMTILAHEVGHHALHHFMNLPEKNIAHQELQADFFAGWILAKLNVPEADVIKGITAGYDATPQGSHYPAQKERVDAALLGHAMFLSKTNSPLAVLENGNLLEDEWLKKWARKTTANDESNLIIDTALSVNTLELTSFGTLLYTKDSATYALARTIPSKDPRYAYLVFDNQFNYWWITKDGTLKTANEEKVLAQVNVDRIKKGE